MKPTQYQKLLNRDRKKAVSKGKIRSLPSFGRMTISKAQEKALDALWSQAVKKVAGNRCEKCFKTEPLNSHHIIGRRNKSTRHLVSNGCCLCVADHFWAEQNGVAFAMWIISKRSQEWWDSLEAQGRQTKVFKDYLLVRKYLESYL